MIFLSFPKPMDPFSFKNLQNPGKWIRCGNIYFTSLILMPHLIWLYIVRELRKFPQFPIYLICTLPLSLVETYCDLHHSPAFHFILTTKLWTRLSSVCVTGPKVTQQSSMAGWIPSQGLPDLARDITQGVPNLFEYEAPWEFWQRVVSTTTK